MSNRSTKVTGLIEGSGGSLVKEGTGTLTLAHIGGNTYTGGTFLDGGTLNVATLGAAGTSPTSDIVFGTGNQTLKIQNAALSSHTFRNHIDGFDVGDKIDLAGLAFKANAHIADVEDLGGGDFKVEVKSGTVTDTLTFSGSVAMIKVKSDGHGGTELVMTGGPERPDDAAAADGGSDAFQLDAQHDLAHHNFIL